jgi:hypothetical protein
LRLFVDFVGSFMKRRPRDAQGQATLLPWSEAFCRGPATELLEPEPHPTRAEVRDDVMRFRAPIEIMVDRSAV